MHRALVDRASKMTLIERVTTKHANIVSAIIIDLLRPMERVTHTIALDNGKEFSGHEEIAKSSNVAVYFAHPCSSWERGLHENTNGLVRQYIKKGSSFERMTNQKIKFIENRLNNRPRKILGYYTPNELYEQAIVRPG